LTFSLAKKPQIVAVNKIDLPEVKERQEDLRNSFAEAGVNVVFISALEKKGTDGLMQQVWETLQPLLVEKPVPQEESVKVFHPRPKDRSLNIKVHRDGDVFIISSPEMERLIVRPGRRESDLKWQMQRECLRLGVNKLLEKAGIKSGDRVRCGDIEWDGRVMKIGIFGGTFDPIHNAHLAVAREVQLQLGLSLVLFVPAGQPWLKVKVKVSPAEDRVNMVRLAIAHRRYYKLSMVDIERPGPTYSVDTVAELRSRYGIDNEYFFILGLDSLLHLSSWYEPARLIQMCQLVAVPRPGSSFGDLKELEEVLPNLSQRVIFSKSRK